MKRRTKNRIVASFILLLNLIGQVLLVKNMREEYKRNEFDKMLTFSEFKEEIIEDIRESKFNKNNFHLLQIVREGGEATFFIDGKYFTRDLSEWQIEQILEIGINKEYE